MNDAYAHIVRHVKEASVLSSISSLLSWDESTHMPRDGAAHRGEQMALMARLHHEMLTSPRLADWLGAAQEGPLDVAASANVREVRRQHERAVKVPAALVEEIAR